MSRKHTLTALVLLVIFILNNSTASQAQRAPITGEWRIEFTRKNPEEVQLSMTLGTAPGTKSQNWGSGIAITELQGLSREQAMNSAVDVHLRLVRDAGTFELVGSFRDGKGSGRFTLTPDEGFFSALASRGYPNLSDNNVFSAAMSGLKIASIDELTAAVGETFGPGRWREITQARVDPSAPLRRPTPIRRKVPESSTARCGAECSHMLTKAEAEQRVRIAIVSPMRRKDT